MDRAAELNRRLEVYGRCAVIAFNIDSPYSALLANWVRSYRRTQTKLRAL